MTGPAIVPLRGAILLQGAAVIDAARCVSAAIEGLRRRDGIAAPDRLRVLDRALRAEAAEVMAQARQHDDAGGADVPLSPRVHVRLASGDGWLSTKEAAATMGTSLRTAQRFAQGGAGRLVGGRWLVDPGAVVAFASEKRAS